MSYIWRNLTKRGLHQEVVCENLMDDHIYLHSYNDGEWSCDVELESNTLNLRAADLRAIADKLDELNSKDEPGPAAPGRSL